ASRAKIRLGIINDHFTPQTETFATIPVFEHLDRSRFEIYLYALNTSAHPLEQYCQSRADKLVALPKEFAAQVQTIRADDLDILFFGTNLTAINKPTTSLAMHRLARIQTTSFCSPTTTGSRHLDYYIAGSFAVPDASYREQYREELAILEGSGFCFNYATESEIALVKPTRQSLGLDDKTTVFISGANFYKILPELRETWIKILAAVPNSVLILYPFGPAWTRNYPTAPFVNNFNALCAKHGIDSNRLCFVKQLPSRADVKEFLQLADVYLDSYPYAGATSLIDPLQVGLPTVVVEGNALRFRQGAAMLRELGIPDLIARDETSYIQLAVSLATNPQVRQQKRQEIQQKMQGNPRCFDSVAYARAIGNLFQELFTKWQNSHQEAARTFKDNNQQQSIELSHILANAIKLYHRNSSNTSAIAELRQIRKQIADFWLQLPAENLETAYNSEAGNNYQTLLFSGFQTQPLLEEEQIFLQQLTQISKGLVHPQAINALLAGMLYFPPGTMRIPDARNRLPHWLIGDYERVFEPENSANSASSSDLLSQYIQSPQFVNQLLGCVNLYRIDPSDGSVILELRQLRKQLTDFWLSVPPEKLETAYSGQVRKAYQALLESGLQSEKLTETEEKFLLQLTETSKGLVHAQAINALLGAMLYLLPGKMRVPDARTRLPQWLFADYEKVFESVFVAAEQTAKQNYLPQFLHQLTEAMNLYQTDRTSDKALADLRKIRQQIADLWLSVSDEQLEVLYRSDFGKGYKAMLDSGFINEPLNEVDRAFLDSLIVELSKGFGIPKATNYLLAARLYCRQGQLQVQDSNTCLPPWLLEDYKRELRVES
ncbi:MAG: glycosyltransferase, partial [Microcoleus sp.]